MSGAPARIEIAPFVPAHLPAMARFSGHTWTHRPGGEEFHRWRYLEAPAQRVILALRGEEIVATIATFERDYLVDGRRRTCLETLDWYCLPEYRGSGLGIRVLQSLMKSGDPIVAVGGTADTLSLLPRLGFRRLAMATCHRLPLGGRSSAETLQRRYRLPVRLGEALFAGLRPWFAPRVRQRPAGGEVRSVDVPGDDLPALYEGRTGYGVLPLPRLPHLRWLAGGSFPMGPFVILEFRVGGALRGWTLLRVHGPDGRREATLVDAYAPQPDEALYTWMVSETLARAAASRPEAVNTQTTCPILRRALVRNRFLAAGEIPIHAWPGDFATGSDPVHMVANASDGALIPYPSA